MKSNFLTCLYLLACSATIAYAAAAELPARAQQRILAVFPQADVNGDGKVTIEELKQAYLKLPADTQSLLQKRFPGFGNPSDPARNKAKDGAQKGGGNINFVFPEKQGRGKGLNCLLLGHSFFYPIVRHLSKHAEPAGLTDHRQYIGQSGGASGSPGRLWTSTRPGVMHAKKLLEQGNVELIAMTAYIVGSTLEDYKRWIDLALKHNPKTRVIVQAPWTPRANREFKPWAEEAKQVNERIHDMIDQLRKEYPGTTFQSVPQGLWMAELWRLFEAGELPELKRLTGKGKGKSADAVFRDTFGHGGPLAEELGALLWLNVIYGIDLNEYEYDTGNQYDYKALAQKICDSDPYTKASN